MVQGRCASSLGLGEGKMLRYRVRVLLITFLTYMSYHLSRKASSVTKGVFHPHVESPTISSNWNPVTNPGWSPFSDDLNPAIVSTAGYTVKGSQACELDTDFYCVDFETAKDYYDQKYCAKYQTKDEKFYLSLFSNETSSNALAQCQGVGGVPEGCWELSATYNNLTLLEQQTFCNKGNATHGVEPDCTLYVQAGGHLIPASSGDKIDWELSKTWTKNGLDDDIQVHSKVTDGKVLLGSCDTVYLIFYALGMFFSGHIADNMSLRLFLFIGMMGSGVCVALIGFAKIWKIHSLWYFYVVYAVQGIFQSSGWPAVVAVMGNWFGKDTRGLVMGIWNAHTSVGNILGALISGAALGLGMNGGDWPAAYFISGSIIGAMSLVVAFFLPNHPHDVDLPSVAEEEAARYTGELEESYENFSANREGREDSLLSSPVSARSPSNNLEAQGPKKHNFLRALSIPGVLEFAFALFFAKFVAYMFIYWLPYYLGHLNFSSSDAANLSTAFDVGGIFGGIMAGWISDKIGGRRAPVAFVYLVLAVPSLFFYKKFSTSVGTSSIFLNVLLMFICGGFVNGPYALITTAVSADLGSHPSLRGDLSLTATVTGIIDGTGSIGASIQGILIGLVSSNCNQGGKSWNAVFNLLMICSAFSAVMLIRLVWKQGPGGGPSLGLTAYRATVTLFMGALVAVAIYAGVEVINACGTGEGCHSFL